MQQDEVFSDPEMPNSSGAVLNKTSVESELVDLSTAARMLGVSRQATYQHIVRGHLESVHAGTSSLVWVKEVKALRAKLEVLRQQGDPLNRHARRKSSKKGRKASEDIKRTVDKIAQLRVRRDADVKNIKNTYNNHINTIRDPAQRKKLKSERDRKIREIKKACTAEISKIRRSIQKPKL